jgi:hypothetical protein
VGRLRCNVWPGREPSGVKVNFRVDDPKDLNRPPTRIGALHTTRVAWEQHFLPALQLTNSVIVTECRDTERKDDVGVSSTSSSLRDPDDG